MILVKENKMIDPTKMTRTVRQLYELSLVKNLGPRKLALFVEASHMQIYTWFNGGVPTLNSEQVILAGIERIKKEVPDSGWGRRWNADPGTKRDKRDAERFLVAMDEFFRELEEKASEDEKTKYLTDEVLLDFQNIMNLTGKYKIKVPKC